MRQKKKLTILITGTTHQHVGNPSQLNAVLTPPLVGQALCLAGHEVEQRSVIPGENLRSRYDVVISFIWNPEASNARHLYGAVYSLFAHPNSIAAYDDWNIANIYSGLRRFVRNPSNFERVEKMGFKREHPAEGKRYLDRIIACMADIVEGRRYRIALSLFPWGERARLPLPNIAMLREYDPSILAIPYYQPLRPSAGVERERRWIFATLGNHTPWLEKLGLTWPVECYGVRRLGQARIQELDVLRRSTQVECALAFKTRISGSGWYRPRFIQAAIAECVIAGDLRDTAPIGRAYEYLPAQVEQLSHKARRELAKEQRNQFMQRIATKDELVSRLDQLVKEAA